MLSGVDSSTTSVFSARALPRASIVNLTDVRVRGKDVSGIDVRLDSLWWCAFEGDVLPEGRELTGRLVPTPDPLACCVGRTAGARADIDDVPLPRLLLPRF